MAKKKKKKKQLELGKRIAATRVQRGLSQGLVARRAGTDPSYLSRIETGKVHPTVRTAMRIAAALRISLDDLLGPSPADYAGRDCPVSPSGHCLMDLIDTHAGEMGAADPEKYTPRQLRLLGRFTSIVRDSDRNLLRAMEVLMDQILVARKAEAESKQ
jgi:transcriptional regulator with XRE-family HTH domain